MFRLLRPTYLRPGVDPGRGVTRSVAGRMSRLRAEIAPWTVFWDRGEYPVTLGGSLYRRTAVSYSDVVRGPSAPRYLDFGYDRRRGFTLEDDAGVFVEGVGFAVDAGGRFRADADAVSWRFLNANLRLGWRNLRLVLGREPLAYGPQVHGQMLLSTNARPLDQVRLENDVPFRLFGQDWLGRFTASGFLGRLDDPNRTDVPNPWLFGYRLTWTPWRWLLLGGTRTTLLGGEGNGYTITFDSILDLLLARNANRKDPGTGVNETDHKAALDWSVYLWPVFRHLPVLDGGRFYGEYAGEDSPQGNLLPSAPGRTYGLELVAGGILVRAESSADVDEANLWYYHRLYRDGYTYRGRVMGHPMGGDSRAQSYDLEVPVGVWGLAVAGWERQEHGYHADGPLIPPRSSTPPVPHSTQDILSLGVEFHRGLLPGLRAEVRFLREFGDVERNGPLEDWGVTLEWRK